MLENFVGKRFLFEGEAGTIKYFGPVDSKDGIWFGVQFDNPNRGKHSGRVGATEYFTTLKPTQGLFLSANKVLDFGRGFIEALEDKYLGKADEKIVHNHSINKEIETVGWSKIEAMVSRLDRLEIIGLSNMRISKEDRPEMISKVCPLVQDIDLSRNLLPCLSAVADICRGMPRLKILRLNKMVMKIPSLSIPAFLNVTVLCLNDCLLQWNQVKKLSVWFPSLVELHLASNHIGHLEATNGFQSLQLLNLKDNLICDWNQVEFLADLPNLTSLDISNNQIQNIIEDTKFRKLQYLNISNNRIDTWKSINNLNNFISLNTLRVFDNPIVDELAVDKQRVFIIGKLSRLTKLAGSAISEKRRRDAEIYYLHHSIEDFEKADFKELHPRYEELCQMYGTPVRKNEDRFMDRVFQLKFVDPILGLSAEKKVPKTTSIRNLKSILAKSLYGNNWNRYIRMPVLWVDSGDLVLSDEMKNLEYYGIDNGNTLKFSY
jgi:Leucine-rich repeat (LRR) protein